MAVPVEDVEPDDELPAGEDWPLEAVPEPDEGEPEVWAGCVAGVCAGKREEADVEAAPPQPTQDSSARHAGNSNQV